MVREPEGKGWFVTIRNKVSINLSICQRRYDELSTDYRTFKAVLESTRSLLYENARRFACKEREREEMAEERKFEADARYEIREREGSWKSWQQLSTRTISSWKYGAVALRRNAQTKFSIFKRRLSPLVLSKYPLRTLPQFFDSTSNR